MLRCSTAMASLRGKEGRKKWKGEREKEGRKGVEREEGGKYAVKQ